MPITLKRNSFGILILTYLSIAILSLILGETPWTEVWHDAMEKIFATTYTWNPLLDERIPRLIVLSCTGASLPVAGCVMQGLFRNPLAAPSVLGISAGSSLAVTLTLICGLHHLNPCILPLAASSGALGTLLIVQILGRIQTTHSLILAGMAISTLLLACQDFLVYAMRNNWTMLQTLSEWQSGDAAHLNWQDVHMQLPLTLLGLWRCWHYRREIDLLSLGEEQAMALGVNVSTVRWRLFVCTALLTGSSIAVLGILPFLGLILPHLLRQFSICIAKSLIPWCIMSGAIFLVLIDSFLRFFAPSHATLGNVTALLGGFFFLSLLLKRSSKQCIDTRYVSN